MSSYDEYFYDRVEAMHDALQPTGRALPRWKPRWSIRRKLRKIARAKHKASKAGIAYKDVLKFELNVGIPFHDRWYHLRFSISEQEAEPIKVGLMAYASKYGLIVDTVHVTSHGITLSDTAYETWHVTAHVS